MDRTFHIDLDLDVRGDEITGFATVAGEPQRPFTGWVGLLSALDALVEAPPPEPEPG